MKQPQSAALYAVLGGVYWDSGLMSLAEAALRTATQLAPRSETASLALFHILWECGEKEAAIQEIQRFNGIGYSNDYAIIIDEIIGGGDG